ncbi:MAG: GNAT family N-acetyltransferase [Pseudomonadota bacterium]
MLELTIRNAHFCDAAEVGVIGYASWRKGIAPLVPSETHALVSEATFADFIREYWKQILIAELAGRIAGIAATEEGDNYISDLWVSPLYEGLGVGTTLITALERRVSDRGFDTVEIEVMTANRRALDLYLNLGYVITWQDERMDTVLQAPLHKTALQKKLRR